jgi:chaperonin GroEL
MVTTELTNDFNKALEGLNLTADVVKSTMGGRGKTVVISDSNAKNLRFTKDGVSVARKISFEDPLKNIGGKILLSACEKTVDEVGDGTTATAVLLQALIKRASKYIQSDTDINDLFKNMDLKLKEIIEKIRNSSQEVSTPEQIRDIAKISSNSEEIGKLFYEIYKETGLDTLIKLEKSDEAEETYFEIIKGLEFSSGYAHSSFMTNKETEQSIYENVYIHIEKTALTTITEQLKQILSHSQEEGVPVLILAPRFSDAVIRALSMNKTNNNLMVVPVKTPGFGNAQRKNIEDIEAFVDADGAVEKVIVGPNYFVLYNEDTPFLEERVKELNSLKNHALDDYETTDIINRIYKLKGSSVIIYAGGITSEAISEEYDRLEDAIGSVNAAIDYGYVSGAGMALYELYNPEDINIVNQVLIEPAYQILKNANLTPEVILSKVKKDFVFDVKKEKYLNFKDSGIIDPTEVVIQALVNAVAMCKLFINSSYILHNHFEEKSPFKL